MPPSRSSSEAVAARISRLSWRGWPFGVRLAAAFAAVGLAAAGMTALLVNVAFADRFDRYLEASQQQREQQLAAALAESYDQAEGWEPAEVERIAATLLMDGGRLELVDTAGGLVWAGDGGPHAAMHREMMGTGPLGLPETVPVTVDGALAGSARVQLPEPGLLPRDVAFRRSINQLLLAAGIAAGLAALALGAVMARRVTTPARELTRAARALAAGDRTRRLTVERGDEFGEMAAAFNRMASELETEDRLRRGFAADVAHELRTPLMILRGEIEALEDGLVEATPAALASLREETLRLARLVDDLDTLAKADAAEFTLAREPTSLADVLHDTVAALTGPADERGVRVESAAEPELVVEGDPARLSQVVGNLLANAVQLTPAGGVVRVRAYGSDDAAVVEVADTGPGIPEDELDHIFDRFYRGRLARAGGSGIGLTVVRQLVEAHGGTVTAANRPSGGATFAVRLPLLARAAASPRASAGPSRR
jgi:two-component system, OmpR family, sensor histidine kinase BaeS